MQLELQFVTHCDRESMKNVEQGVNIIHRPRLLAGTSLQEVDCDMSREEFR